MKSPGILSVGRNRTVRNRFTLLLEDIPPETCGLGFNVIGVSRDRRPVYGSFYLKVRKNPMFTAAVTDKQTLLALEELGKTQSLVDPDTILVDQLYELSQRGLIKRTPNGWSPQ